MMRLVLGCCALLALSACSQIQQYRCVRDIVNSQEPYPTTADRVDTESFAKQICAQRAASGGK
jgi:hypothetical protein